MADRLPLLIVSDAPGRHTGLSRIATDLCARIDWATLGVDLLQVGATPGPLPREGVPLALAPWPVWGWDEGYTSDVWATAIPAALRWHYGAIPPRGVLWVIEDPARAYSALEVPLPVGWSRWGYLSVDAVNVNGTLSGPAAVAVQRLGRVLGYGRFGADVLSVVRGEPVLGIPHGYDPAIFRPTMTPDEHAEAVRLLNPTGSDQPVIGCVATNQARKDWGMVAQTIRLLRETHGKDVRLWAHCDRPIGEAWVLPQLFRDCGLDWRAATVTERLTDRQLACCYALCVATIAPGRGEGFGYPILESLACGTPVVHGDAGGGSDLLPAWGKVPAAVWPLVGPYALQRPLLNPRQVADQLLNLSDAMTSGATLRQECLTRAAAYQWAEILPAWQTWVAAGVDQVRQGPQEGV